MTQSAQHESRFRAPLHRLFFSARAAASSRLREKIRDLTVKKRSAAPLAAEAILRSRPIARRCMMSRRDSGRIAGAATGVPTDGQGKAEGSVTTRGPEAGAAKFASTVAERGTVVRGGKGTASGEDDGGMSSSHPRSISMACVKGASTVERRRLA